MTAASHYPCLGLPRKVVLTHLRERCREIRNWPWLCILRALGNATRLEVNKGWVHSHPVTLTAVTVSQARGSKSTYVSGIMSYVPTHKYILKSQTSRLLIRTTPTHLRDSENIQAEGQVTIKRRVSSSFSLLFGSSFVFSGALSLLRRSFQLSIQ